MERRSFVFVALALTLATVVVAGCSGSNRQAENFCLTGMERLRDNDLSEASSCFRKAIELNPRMAAPRVGLGEIALRDYDYAEAERCFSEKSACPSRPSFVR